MIARGGLASPCCNLLSPTTKLMKLTLLCCSLAVILPFAISVDDDNTTQSVFGSVVESVTEFTDLVPDSITGLIPGSDSNTEENTDEFIDTESSNTDNISTETTIELIPGSTENADPVNTEELTMVEEPTDTEPTDNETIIPESITETTDTDELTPETTTNTLYHCIDPINNEQTSTVRRGEEATLCLYIGPDGDWNNNIEYKRFSVNLKADEFSSYHIPGSYDALTVTGSGTENQRFNGGNSTHVFAASQTSLSFLRRYYDQTTKRIYPYLTAILDVQQGLVRGIAWDDACVFCEQAECNANTYNLNGSLATTEEIRQPVNGCSYSKNECRLFVKDGSDICDLKLHVVWTGTDVDGKVLLSSDSRPSAFPPNRIQENVKGRYDKMVKSLSDLKDQVTGG
mmetsp:Transcript_3079/g.5938  ORF Transcript_3079/g.5938 Transcript_3079/m.5938 type:complete len:400 (-) Transcript_3079:388-1587(-)|eukprot:CAMPEP_0201677888 /NCGR_PEP_ID=MMETSP0494-20130426/45043_1 /ASSEMBLY_ACC=CAM_ASM_000839 /TAXON_ID=420259 /ORGANISM="Thalassiosira gravida, Strain GMp14c1" /LENGTH=399 /DNA_ID=CAMNT_0048160941 /DNA_START=121 /DNA_END=1320 /DNA_ORIENTATION=+